MPHYMVILHALLNLIFSVYVFFINIQHAPLQSNITCFSVKQLQYGYI